MIKKPKILLIGCSGQLGTVLQETLEITCNLIKPKNEKFLFISFFELKRILDKIKPEIIINTLAFTQVDNAERDQEKAFFLNAKFPEMISSWCSQNKCFLVHYSSDYVYSGEGNLPMKETNDASPICHYGVTKLKGDNSIQKSGARSIILRCSWVYSLSHNSFLKTILEKMYIEKDLKIVNDQIGTPTSAKWIAMVTQELIKNNYMFKNFNLIHCTPMGYVSWYEFCLFIFKIMKSKGYNLKTKNIIPISSKNFYQKAKRPKNSRLDNSRLVSFIDFEIPHWQDILYEELKKL